MEAFIREKDGIKELCIELDPGTRLILDGKEIGSGRTAAIIQITNKKTVAGQWLICPGNKPGEYDMYCSRCGEKLAAVSPEDAREVREFYEFCYRCGADMREGAGHEDK